MSLLAKIHQVRQAKLAVVKTGEIKSKNGIRSPRMLTPADEWTLLP